MSPPVLIAIVAVGVLLLGGLVFFVGRATAGGAEEVPLAEQQVIEETAEVVTPIPDAPAPSVEPIPEQPSMEPIPEEPVVESIPEEPMVDEPMVEEPVVEEPVTDQPVEDQPVNDQPVSSGSTIEVGAGISAVVPTGWEAKQLDEATVAMGTDGGGALLGLYTAPAGATGAELIAFYMQETLSSELTDLEVTQPEPLSIDSPSVTSAATNLYRGTYVSQQGSFPLEGIIWAFIRADGTALVIDGYWAPGVDITAQLVEIASSALSTM